MVRIEDKAHITSILLVEDEMDLREYFGEFLKSEGFKVTEASNGIEALLELEKNSFDFIISDIQMPLLDGFGLLRAICLKKQKMPKIIMMSGNFDNEKLAKELGAMCLVSKPFDVNLIISLIKNQTIERTA